MSNFKGSTRCNRALNHAGKFDWKLYNPNLIVYLIISLIKNHLDLLQLVLKWLLMSLLAYLLNDLEL